MLGRTLCGLWITALAACGDDSAPPLGDGGGPCTTNADCDDGNFCTGVETCDPANPAASAHGCVPASSPCMALQTCVEADDECVTRCAETTDADGDGVIAIECGGLDCNDADPRTYPERFEVCDPNGHDEDCDPTTIGARDLDADGHTSSICANTADDGTVTQGDDCDDNRSASSPAETERCDGLDNDCNGTIDDGVGVAGFRDADGDGDGDPDMPATACPDSARFSESGGDCDDGDLGRNSFQVEVCDREDNDCDGTIDETPAAVPWYLDDDGDGFGRRGSPAPEDVVVSCSPPIGARSYSLLATDCDDTRGGINPAAAEQCDGLDNDCNGRLDGETGARPGDFEDDDADGIADAACTFGSNDCDDTDPFTGLGGGLVELCGDERDNDCDGTIDEMADPVAWYPDADADAYADGTGAAVTSCELQLGYSYRLGDCDDTSAARHPGAYDGCDRVDQDCDGRADEDAPAHAFYFDADGDGAGVETGALYACGDPPPGYGRLPRDCAPLDDMTTSAFVDADGDSFGDSAMALTTCTGTTRGVPAAGDCNDRDIDVNPSIAEVCNGIDDDCDEGIDETGGMGCPPGAVWTCGGSCELVMCMPGFVDCGTAAIEGCADMTTSALHCGGCGRACGVASSCEASACSSEIVEIDVHQDRGCALRANGRVACWGEVTDTATHRPVDMGLEGVERIAVGQGALCFRVPGDEFHCEGGRSFRTTAALGLGFSPPPRAFPPTPMAATGLERVRFATNFGCGLRPTAPGPEGTVLCWGDNTFGQLGNGTEMDSDVPVTVLGITDAIDVCVGGFHACVARMNGDAECWGRNESRQLGDGSTDPYATRPTVVSLTGTDVDPVTNVVCGGDYACALRSSGEVWCWGPSGIRLGGGPSAGSGPLRVQRTTGPLPPARALASSQLTYMTCAALAGSGDVYCWGVGTLGGPGDANYAIRTGTLTDVVQLSGATNVMCGRTASHRVFCWGIGSHVGTGSTTELLPAELLDLNPAD